MSDLRVRVLASGPLDAQQRGLALAPRYGMDPDRVVRVEEIPESRSRRTRSALWEVDVRGSFDLPVPSREGVERIDREAEAPR